MPDKITTVEIKHIDEFYTLLYYARLSKYILTVCDEVNLHFSTDLGLLISSNHDLGQMRIYRSFIITKFIRKFPCRYICCSLTTLYPLFSKKGLAVTEACVIIFPSTAKGLPLFLIHILSRIIHSFAYWFYII